MIFAGRDTACESDIVEGLALSVECDRHPQQARQILEGLLGPATVVGAMRRALRVHRRSVPASSRGRSLLRLIVSDVSHD
jgi:hypothetical protein